jgi:hypothetical protein
MGDDGEGASLGDFGLKLAHNGSDRIVIGLFSQYLK